MTEQERKALEALDKLYEENGNAMTKLAEDEYRIDTIEERLTRIEDKVDLLITQLKIEFYKR